MNSEMKEEEFLKERHASKDEVENGCSNNTNIKCAVKNTL